MAKRIFRMTIERQNKWFKAHQESIEFEEIIYEPFWRVEDIKSSGIKTKIVHFSTHGRIMHLLSQNELWMYLHLVQSNGFKEIYEQFAIPLEYSIAIAKELEVKHPIYIGSKVPIVQTIDFVTTTSDDKHIAYAVKQESDALRERTIEKLMLQEAYCKLQGIEFELVTSNDIRTIKSENLEALYRHRNISPFQKSIFEIWLSNFLGILSEDRHNRISNIIKTSSEATGISYFQAASYFYYSLWNEYLNINWNQRLKLESPASVLKLSPYEQAV